MSFPLLLDEDIPRELSSVLRREGFDVIHVGEIDRRGLDDASQLEYAVRQGRALFTHNARDFAILHHSYMIGSLSHCGIILGKQRPFSHLVKALIQFQKTISSEELPNSIYYI